MTTTDNEAFIRVKHSFTDKNERATMYGCKKDGYGHGEQTIALRQQDAVKRVVSTSQLSTSELPEDEMEEFLTVNW